MAATGAGNGAGRGIGVGDRGGSSASVTSPSSSSSSSSIGIGGSGSMIVASLSGAPESALRCRTPLMSEPGCSSKTQRTHSAMWGPSI